MSKREFDRSAMQEGETVARLGANFVEAVQGRAYVVGSGQVGYLSPAPYQAVYVLKNALLKQAAKDRLVVCRIERKRGSSLPFTPDHHKHFLRMYVVIEILSVIKENVTVEGEIESLDRIVIYETKRTGKSGYVKVGRKPLSGIKGVNVDGVTITIGDSAEEFYRSKSPTGNLSEGIRNVFSELANPAS